MGSCPSSSLQAPPMTILKHYLTARPADPHVAPMGQVQAFGDSIRGRSWSDFWASLPAGRPYLQPELMTVTLRVPIHSHLCPSASPSPPC